MVPRHTRPAEIRNAKEKGHVLEHCGSKWEGKDLPVKLDQGAFPETVESLEGYSLARDDCKGKRQRAGLGQQVQRCGFHVSFYVSGVEAQGAQAPNKHFNTKGRGT